MLAPQARRVAPDSVPALAQAMREAYAAGDVLAFEGGGTELELGYPAERVDVVVSTNRLAEIVEYAPEDMTVTVEAGMTLAALQAALSEHRQRLALDAPDAQRATLGGVIATNAFGARRARFGSLRDLLLGVTLVRADGVVVRGGGKVVKNVAGFDVPKLLIGSLGTLGCIATATFRLHPVPEAASWVATRCGGGSELRSLCLAFTDAQLEPSAVVARNVAGEIDVYVLFEGFPAGVVEQAAACAQRLAALGLRGALADAAKADAFLAAHEQTRTSGEVRAKVTFPVAALAQMYDGALAQHGRTSGDGSVVVYPTLGIAFCAGASNDGASRALLGIRAAAEHLGGNLVVQAAPPQVREEVDVFGALPPAFALMRRIKERFDPQRRCNRGRFAGKL